MLKDIILHILRAMARLLYFIPIKENRILFTSYLGQSYTCSPKYISKYLAEKYPKKFDIVWAFQNPDKFENVSDIRKIRYKSLQWFITTITSKVIVTNNAAVWIPRRKGQLIIDTWHGGGCYKKVGWDINLRRKISSEETNLMLSSSDFFTERVIRESWHYKGKVLNCGMPRNDVLFPEYVARYQYEIRSKVASKYDFDKNAMIVLFAPTWRRKSERTEKIDALKVKEGVEKRYGRNAVLLGRGHHTEDKIMEDNFIDVTDYPDMQELLIVADVLITDYSSSIWDYSYTYKPCFLFTPDLEEYKINPGFEKDIFEWGFPICESNEKLYDAIIGFDKERFAAAMDKHHRLLGSYENGTAAKQVADYIIEFVGERYD